MHRFALPCLLLAACGTKISVTPGGTGDDTGTATGTDGGTETDGGAETDGGTTATDGGTEGWGPSQIALLQQYVGVSAGDVVTVEGVVTSPDTGSGFYMADAPEPWAGIWVYHDGTATVARGDWVSVTGELVEFNDLTEIDASAGGTTVLGTHALPEPLLVAPGTVAGPPNAEQYEGVLVRLEGPTVTSLNPDHPDDYGEFTVTDGLRVDDYFFDADPGPGETFASLTGILIYSFGQYKLAPRDAADIVR